MVERGKLLVTGHVGAGPRPHRLGEPGQRTGQVAPLQQRGRQAGPMRVSMWQVDWGAPSSSRTELRQGDLSRCPRASGVGTKRTVNDSMRQGSRGGGVGVGGAGLSRVGGPQTLTKTCGERCSQQVPAPSPVPGWDREAVAPTGMGPGSG